MQEEGKAGGKSGVGKEPPSHVSVPQAAAKCSCLTCATAGAASFHVTGEER